jgi:hypothetical protein
VKKQTFHFEIEDLITQFVAAFDDCVIKRFNGQRQPQEQIEVRYVYAPKQRVLYDIVNKDKSLTMPVVTISINSISRDANRVFNKLDGFYYPDNAASKQSKLTKQLPMPVPVNISVNLSVIAKYQTDLEQIISNFIPYANPYIILAWQVPEEFNLANVYEIRSEVEWNNSVTLTYPGDLSPTDKYRVVADTGFTIKGWLFPAADVEPINNIYFIDANFTNTRLLAGGPNQLKYTNYDDYTTIKQYTSGGSFTDVISISAAPQVTDIFGHMQVPVDSLSPITTASPTLIGGPLLNSLTLNYTNSARDFTIIGKNFQYTLNVLLSSNVANNYASSTFAFEYYPTISGYILPTNLYSVASKNVATARLPINLPSGNYTFVFINSAGWSSTYDAYQTVLTIP